MTGGKKIGKKILFFDIETTPNISYTWGKYDQNVIEFKKEWELLSFAHKVSGQQVQCISRRHLDERSLVRSLHDVLAQDYDAVVAHNGKDFDIKKANAKFIQFGMTPVHLNYVIDTKQEAKKHFKFNSNKLDDLGRFLGVGRKIKNSEGFELWLKCMAGDVKAFKQMEKYNIQDVRLLERVYLKLRPWIKHRGLRDCNKCGSSRLQKRGVYRTAVSVYQRYQCQDCGGWSRSRTPVSNRKPDKVDV